MTSKKAHRSAVFRRAALIASGVTAMALSITAGSNAETPSSGEPLSNGMPYSEVVRYSLSPDKLPTASPASVPRADGHPDFTGTWLQDQGILFSDPTPKHHSGSHPGYDDSLNPPPFNAEYAARYKAFKEKVAKEGYNRLYDCDPSGMPRLMANPFPMQLIQTKAELAMLFLYKYQYRQAYFDRQMPSEDDYTPSFNGASVAKWDGETLVIDTGLIDTPPGKLIQITGIEHSDQLHITERVRFLNPNRIEWEITMTDPVVFTKPWVSRRSFTRQPATNFPPEYVCTTGELIGELGYAKPEGGKAAADK